MKKNLVELVIVVDRSGSMSNLKKDAEGGLKSFIEDQKKLPGEAKITLVQFDSQYDVVCENQPINEFQDYTLVPRGSTALIEAIGRTIDKVGNRLTNTPEEERPEKVLFYIITDGQENSSNPNLYTSEKVKQMIEHQETKYSWDFTFFAADINTCNVAIKHYGFKMDKCVLYSADSVGVRSSYTTMSSLATKCRSDISSGNIINVKDNQKIN